LIGWPIGVESLSLLIATLTRALSSEGTSQAVSSTGFPSSESPFGHFADAVIDLRAGPQGGAIEALIDPVIGVHV
jgi:hypothetical protein